MSDTVFWAGWFLSFCFGVMLGLIISKKVMEELAATLEAKGQEFRAISDTASSFDIAALSDGQALGLELAARIVRDKVKK